jgi:hypothetical protein
MVSLPVKKKAGQFARPEVQAETRAVQPPKPFIRLPISGIWNFL